MTGTVPLDDPRRHIRLELRTRQILVAALRGNSGAWRLAWEEAAVEFGPSAFAVDCVTRMPTLLRAALDDEAAEELAARIAEPIAQYLVGSLEDVRVDGAGAEPSGDIGKYLGVWPDTPPWLADDNPSGA